MQLDTANLPENFKDVIEVIGLQSALVLADKLGGIRMYVPERMSDEHPLVETLGRKKAQLLSDHYTGDYLYLPRCAEALRNLRNSRIIAERNQGASTSKLALRYRLTERQVQTIIARGVEKDERQQDMFG